jgi:heterodisulfide reductase subunit B
MMKYAFFLGCVIPVKYPGFEKATREIMKTLDIELVDLPFSCCPAPTSMKLAHYDTWLALAARNLCLAEEAGLSILAMCNGCINTLKEVNLILKQDPQRRELVNKALEGSNHYFKGEIEVKHLLDVLYKEVGPERIAEKVRYPLNGIRVGCHYGCHLYRPPRIMYPDELSEAASYVPESMDHILAVLGAHPTQYSRKFLCCGSALGTNIDGQAANEITREKLQHMKKHRIEAVAVACPSCFSQFDRGQMMLERRHHDGFAVPTLFISQFLGLALGLDRKNLGLGDHRISLDPLLERIGVCDKNMGR